VASSGQQWPAVATPTRQLLSAITPLTHTWYVARGRNPPVDDSAHRGFQRQGEAVAESGVEWCGVQSMQSASSKPRRWRFAAVGLSTGPFSQQLTVLDPQGLDEAHLDPQPGTQAQQPTIELVVQ
jgi:hypothetical protein